jgi:hypothetical protein
MLDMRSETKVLALISGSSTIYYKHKKETQKMKPSMWSEAERWAKDQVGRMQSKVGGHESEKT